MLSDNMHTWVLIAQRITFTLTINGNVQLINLRDISLLKLAYRLEWQSMKRQRILKRNVGKLGRPLSWNCMNETLGAKQEAKNCSLYISEKSGQVRLPFTALRSEASNVCATRDNACQKKYTKAPSATAPHKHKCHNRYQMRNNMQTALRRDHFAITDDTAVSRRRKSWKHSCFRTVLSIV